MRTLFLALESSCDETAAAVFTSDRQILSSVVASQHALHIPFGGVVPEIASRAHVRQILPVVEQALQLAKITLADVGCIAVHNTPGLVGALLVSVTAAKTLSLVLNVPLVAVNHVHAHLYACRIAAERDIFPCVGLVVSGGHTSLYHCRTALDFAFLGGTRDDAAGEAFDKVAAILGLGFPGGPALEREAKAGNPTAYRFPRAFLNNPELEFSFSGLKTAVLYAANGQNSAVQLEPLSNQKRSDLAASFQAAVVDSLVGKSRQALRTTGLTRLAVGGGVTANAALRSALSTMTAQHGYELHIPPLGLCTDNAAMAAMAVEKWQAGDFASADLDAEPNMI